MKNIAVIIALLFLVGAALAVSNQTGTMAGNFLKLGGGVRAASMGNAFVALSDDPSAIYWNPAGLTQLKTMAFSSMHNSFLADMSYSNLTLNLFESRTNLSSGLSLDYVSAGEMEETSASQPYGTGRKFTPVFIALTAPFAFQLLPPLSFGLNVKTLIDRIDTAEAIGYAFDAGILWKITETYSAGFCARNFAGALSEFSQAGAQAQYPLASNYALGLCCRLPNLILALDYNLPSDNQNYYSLGAEYNFRDTFFGRVGFSTRSEENAGGNLGAGLGLKFGMARLDYAYVPYGDLGVTQRIAFSLIMPEQKTSAPSAEAQISAEAQVTAEAHPTVAVTPSIEVQASVEAQTVAPAIVKKPAKPAVVKKAAVHKKAKIIKKKPRKKRRRR
ncbi:MAG: PorV/PorQ family protein [Candidatus Margulisbacteria bacterium]|nr:PorV/PorQ family protein [Candidatus Margulisiibacteriota bacterium]